MKDCAANNSCRQLIAPASFMTADSAGGFGRAGLANCLQ